MRKILMSSMVHPSRAVPHGARIPTENGHGDTHGGWVATPAAPLPPARMRKDERAVATRVAAEVRRLRKAMGWSQLALAERAGLSLNYVNLIERAEQLPTVRVLLQLAAALGTTLRDLVSEPEAGEKTSTEPDPWVVEMVALLRAVPLEGRPVTRGVLRGAVEAMSATRPEGSVVRAKRRRVAR